jgi:glycosyltransferase involved in cell wall biosynthesis
VSAYRTEKFLPAWVANVEATEDLESFEFIIVAVDPSKRELETFDDLVRRHGNFVLEVRSQPFGIYEAWNLGIELSRSDYVTNMNVDDIRSPESLVKQTNVLSKYEWVDVVYQDVLMSLASETDWSQLESIGAVCHLPITTPAILMSGVNPPHNGPMWRKSLHRDVGHFDSSLRSAADFDFWMRCSNQGKVFFNVDDHHVGYFDNPDGVSTSSAGIGIREARRVLNENEKNLLTGPAPHYLLERDHYHPAELRVDRLTRGLSDAILKLRQQ